MSQVDEMAQLAELRSAWWGRDGLSMSDIMKLAYQDYDDVRAPKGGIWNYLADVLDLAGYRHEAEVAQEQREASAELIEEVFENVPEDHVMALIVQELVEDVLEDEVSHKRFE